MFLFAPIRWALRLVGLVLSLALIYVVFCGAQVVIASNDANAAPVVKHVDFIIVTGNHPGSAATSDLVARLKVAVALHRTYPGAPVMVVGPSRSGTSSVPTLAAAWLGAHRIAIRIIQVTSTNSGEFNAAKAAMGASRDAIVVTDAIDSQWAKDAASSAGITPSIAVPTTTRKVAFDELSALWHEATGVAVGRLIGYDHVSWAAT